MEQDKFIDILKEHKHLVYKICHSYCADPTERKDLEQEILLQLWKSIGKFDGRVKLSTWMYKVALNTAVMFYRKSSKHLLGRASLDDTIISFEGPKEDETERIRLLYSMINKMKPNDKALVLLYLEGVKYKEIAEIIGLSETNVATKLGRIKQNMKEQVQQFMAHPKYSDT